MSNNNENKVHKTLIDGIVLLDEFCELLGREREYIEAQETENIADILTLKENMIKKIIDNFKSRQDLILNSGLNIKENELSLYVTKASNEDYKLTEAADMFTHKMELVQDEIYINQSLINRSKENIARLMAALQGKKESDNIYNKLGSTTNVAPSSRIGKA